MLLHKLIFSLFLHHFNTNSSHHNFIYNHFYLVQLEQTTYLVCICWCDKTLDHNQLGEERVYFTSKGNSPSWRQPEQELKAELAGENWNRDHRGRLLPSLLTCLIASAGFRSSQAHQVQDDLSKSGITHSGTVPAHQLIIKKMAPQLCSNASNCLVGVPSFHGIKIITGPLIRLLKNI